MNQQNTISSSQSRQWPSWLVLSLRWLIGGLFTFGLSAWICFGIITNTVTGPLLWIVDALPILTLLFSGPLFIFDPTYFGSKDLISFLSHSFPSIDQNILIVSLPSAFWGLIGAFLASGRKEQIKIGVIMFLLYVAMGCIALFQLFIHIPT